jgi:Tol biopolymer transport system component
VSVAGSISARLSVVPLKGRGAPTRIGRSTLDGLEGVAFGSAGSVIYSSRAGGRASLWVTRPDGSDRRPIVESGPAEYFYFPVAAGDGRVAYISSGQQGVALKVAGMDGSPPRTLATDVRREAIASSSDGNVLAFSALVDGTPHVFTTGLDGKRREQVTALLSFAPAVDPEGRRVAYYYVADGLFRIGVSRVGGGAALLADLPAEAPSANSRLQLVGDGIYVNTVRGDRANVWFQPLDGSPARRLTSFDDQLLFDFAVSADASMLAIVRGTRLRDAQAITGFDGRSAQAAGPGSAPLEAPR